MDRNINNGIMCLEIFYQPFIHLCLKAESQSNPLDHGVIRPSKELVLPQWDVYATEPLTPPAPLLPLLPFSLKPI